MTRSKRRRMRERPSAMPGGGVVGFRHIFKADIREFGGKRVKEKVKFPPFVLCRGGSFIRLTPLFYPEGPKKKLARFTFGVKIWDKKFNEKRGGGVDFTLSVALRSGGLMEVCTSGFDFHTGLGTVWVRKTDLRKERRWLEEMGVLIVEDVICFTLDLTVSEECFSLTPFLPREVEWKPNGGEEMSYQVIFPGETVAVPKASEFLLISKRDGIVFQCHESVMAEASEFFEAAIEYKEYKRKPREDEPLASGEVGRIESISRQQGEAGAVVTLDFSGSVLLEVCSWIYKGRLVTSIGDRRTEELMEAAEFLLLWDLKEFCVQKLIESTTALNAWRRFKMGKLFELEVLKHRALALLGMSCCASWRFGGRGVWEEAEVVQLIEEMKRAVQLKAVSP